jgi:hypothetical protein
MDSNFGSKGHMLPVEVPEKLTASIIWMGGRAV